jgi:alginate O-acetyltransferase complex protein AlgJ
MLFRCNRLWLLFMAAILLAPAAIQLGANTDALSPDENRVLSPLPALPRHLKDLRGWSGRFDAYLRDHFGGRHAIIRAHVWMTQFVSRNGNAQVLLGRDGWMFFRGDHMLEQSSGQLVRRAAVEVTVDVLSEVNSLLAARGSKLVVASPPNSATIYFDKIDGWPHDGLGKTEYDVHMDLLAQRNIVAVDLRPILRAARTQGDTYLQHDTHWNARGALEAFNAIATKAGLANWQIASSTALAPEARITGGDLAGMLGIADYLTQLDSPLKLAVYKRVDYSTDPLVYEITPEVRRGPTVLVLGDSFTRGHLAPMIAANGGRAIWLHHQGCEFDWQWIEKFQPDQVWYMPTERYFLCAPGRRPKGMPGLRGATAALQ